RRGFQAKKAIRKKYKIFITERIDADNNEFALFIDTESINQLDNHSFDSSKQSLDETIKEKLTKAQSIRN
ncbi:4823_t:CDS:1, partial [Gigaspora rosea]